MKLSTASSHSLLPNVLSHFVSIILSGHQLCEKNELEPSSNRLKQGFTVTIPTYLLDLEKPLVNAASPGADLHPRGAARVGLERATARAGAL